MNQLLFKNIHKSFSKKDILKGISFTLKTGDILGVFGRNGTGKSTLIKIIYGLIKAENMVFEFNRQEYNSKAIIPEQLIAYLPQDSFLPKELTVNSIIPLAFPDSDAQDAIFYADRIASMEHKKVGKLSIGELRYLEFLLISHMPHPFLILDEPFSMIEPLFKEVIASRLIDLKQSKGILITDHYYTDVLKIATRNILLQDGKCYPINGIEDLKKSGYISTNGVI